MRITRLIKSNVVYTCNSYLLRGEWNRIGDMNTLIDPGTDTFIIDEIERISTGFGKVPVEQIILTHNHFDHAASVQALKKKFGCMVLANHLMEGVDRKIVGGDVIRAGDGYLDVLHTPFHSSDSICLFCKSEGVLFSGDTVLRVLSPGGTYPPEYINTLTHIASLPIKRICPGHNDEIRNGISEILAETIRNVRFFQL